MKTANPYLNFPGNTEEAFKHYRTVFGGEFAMLVRFEDFPGGMGAGESDLRKIAHIALPIGKDAMLMANDTIGAHGRELVVGNNFYIMVEADTANDADRLFAGLSDGGRVEMPLQKTEWSEKYGICADKFGVQWMVSYTGDVRFELGT